MLRSKAGVAVGVLRADSGDLQASGDKILMDVSNRAGLARTARREISRIEIEHQWAAVQQPR